MNRLIMCILALSFTFRLSGQMFPLSDQFQNNPLVINPAFAGCHDALSATVSYRNQWVGFKDAPQNYMLSVHAPINKDRIGLGFFVEKSSIGIYKKTNFSGNYAFRTELQDGILALGVAFGVSLYNIGWSDLDVTDADDVELLNNPTSAVLPNFSLGTYYYTKKYFIGISLPSFLSHEPDQSSGIYKTKNNSSGYNYFLTGGYEFEVSPQVKLLPSLLVKYHPENAVQIDYNAIVNLKEKLGLGIGYRNKNMLIGTIQCQLNYQLKMAYTYDFDFGSIGKYKNGSHEIFFNYIFKYSRKIMGPRQF